LPILRAAARRYETGQTATNTNRCLSRVYPRRSNLVAAQHALVQLQAEGKPVPPELQRQFSPTLNAHINKIGKFDIDPNRGSPRSET
jgi:hypothetical protein